MATIEQCEELLSVCATVLKSKANEKKFYDRPEWGEMSFRDIRSHLEIIIWMAEELTSLPNYKLRMIPGNIVASATSRFTTIVEDLHNINQFTISAENAPTMRSQYTVSLTSNADKAIGTIGPWMPLLAMKDEEREDLSAQMRAISVRATELLEETNEYVEKSKSEIDSVLRVARTESSEAGAAQFTRQFNVEADNARTRVVFWLVPTGFFVAAAFSLSVLFMLGLFIGAPTSALEMAYGIGGRVIGISVLFYAAIWSGRIALANMHLTSVNRHRAISLETLQAFQNAVDDLAARDAVVLEAARAVYENVPSGYIGRQAGEQSSGGRVLELIRNTRPQSGQQ